MYLVFILLAGAVEVYADAYVPDSRSLSENGYEVSVGASYFQSSQRVDPNGVEYEFADGESYSSLNSSLRLEYGFTSFIDFSADINLRQNQAQIYFANQLQEYQNNGAESLWLGVEMASAPAWYQYAFEAKYKLALFSANQEDILLGDEGDGYSVALSTYLAFDSQMFMDSKAGLRRVGSELADELFLDAKLGFNFKHFAIAAGVNYVDSLGNDPSRPEDGPLNLATDNTELFNSYNRSFTAPYGEIVVAFNKVWRMEFQYSRTIAGISTDLGSSYGLRLVRRISDRTDYTKKNNTFKQYEISASVIKVSSSGSVIIIDKGIEAGLKKGSTVDFYSDNLGEEGAKLIATGVVTKLNYQKSVVRIQERFKRIPIKAGSSAQSGVIY